MLGIAGRLGRVLNPILNHRFLGERLGRAWLLHNVEEVGLFEQLLRLCTRRAEYSSLDGSLRVGTLHSCSGQGRTVTRIHAAPSHCIA